MERKEGVKIEEGMNSSSFLDCFSSSYGGVFDLSEEEKSNGSLGFMDLLGFQDFGPSLFDVGQQGTTYTAEAAPPTSVPNSGVGGKIECPDAMINNQPATPNSSSISSESCDGVNDHERVKIEDQEEDQAKTKRQLKPKKTNQKRQREPRFAFMTKSEVDHLEDGYRWRKYGQKAVKNSPFPRSYYRCTNSSCNVKKRVERNFNDPTIVVTTYEGQHTHPSPMMPRPSICGGAQLMTTAAANFPVVPMQRISTSQLSPYDHQRYQTFPNNLSTLNNFSQNGSSFVHHERRFCTPAAAPISALPKDHGLLQDIIPSNMMKEE